MARAWALAEVISPTSPMQQMSECNPVRAKLRDGGTLSETDWQVLEHGIRWARQPMLDPLLALHPTWYRGELPVDVLAGARTINLPAYVERAPSRQLAALCATRGQSEGAPEFHHASMTAPAILVGPTLDGPWCLVEGYRRCCRAIRDDRAGRFDGLPLSVIVGVGPDMSRWRWWL